VDDYSGDLASVGLALEFKETPRTLAPTIAKRAWMKFLFRGEWS
jgi:hypothetical protein